MHDDEETPTHEHCGDVLGAVVRLHDDGIEVTS